MMKAMQMWCVVFWFRCFVCCVNGERKDKWEGPQPEAASVQLVPFAFMLARRSSSPSFVRNSLWPLLQQGTTRLGFKNLLGSACRNPNPKYLCTSISFLCMFALHFLPSYWLLLLKLRKFDFLFLGSYHRFMLCQRIFSFFDRRLCKRCSRLIFFVF